MPGKSFPQTQSGLFPPPPAALTWPFLLQQPHIGGEGEPRVGWMPSRGRGGRSGMLVVAGSSKGGKALAAMSVGQGREAAFRSFLEQWIGGHPGAPAQWLPNLDAYQAS